MAEVEQELPGNVGGAVRIGQTVRRPVGYWTPAVHQLLEYLQDRLPHIPQVHGFDEQGREVLDFLPGQVIDSARQTLNNDQLTSLLTWTRDFHQAVTSFHHDGPWRYFPMSATTSDDPTFIGHNDIAPYNACFEGDALRGIFDWDLAGPTTALNELAFIAWNCVPLCRAIEPALAAARLRLIAETYGKFDPVQILAGVPPRIRTMLEGIPRAAAAGDIGMQNLMGQGEPERSRLSLAALETRMPAIRTHLT